MTNLDTKRQEIERKGRVREFVFGIQDGLISTVGLLSGIQSATSNNKIVILAGFTAMASGAISMSVGSYLSSKAEKEVFDRELKEQEKFVEDVPYLAQEGLVGMLEKEGMGREVAYRIVKLMQREKSVFVQTFQEKVLGLGSADISNPLKGAMVMAASFLVGSFMPMIPYFFTSGAQALWLSVALSVTVLFGVGVMKGYMAGKHMLISGLEFFAIALAAALSGYLIGWIIETAFHIRLPTT